MTGAMVGGLTAVFDRFRVRATALHEWSWAVTMTDHMAAR